jgi:hypothetical protein
MNRKYFVPILAIIPLTLCQGCYLFCLFKEDPFTEKLMDHLIHEKVLDDPEGKGS